MTRLKAQDLTIAGVSRPDPRPQGWQVWRSLRPCRGSTERRSKGPNACRKLSCEPPWTAVGRPSGGSTAHALQTGESSLRLGVLHFCQRLLPPVDLSFSSCQGESMNVALPSRPGGGSQETLAGLAPRRCRVLPPEGTRPSFEPPPAPCSAGPHSKAGGCYAAPPRAWRAGDPTWPSSARPRAACPPGQFRPSEAG